MDRDFEHRSDIVALCELTIQRDRIVHSPELQLAKAVWRAVLAIKGAAGVCARLPHRIWRILSGEKSSRDGGDLTISPLEKVFPVEVGYSYRLEGCVLTPQLSKAQNAAILSVAYLDSAGAVLDFESKGFQFSQFHGYYQYLQGSIEGQQFSLELVPCTSAVAVLVRIRQWLTDSALSVGEVSVERADVLPEVQLARVERVIGKFEHKNLDYIAVFQLAKDIGETIADVEGQLIGESGLVIAIGDSEKHAKYSSEIPERTILISQAVFRTLYRRIAAIPAKNRLLVLTSADFHSVLYANRFRHHGWDVRFEEQQSLRGSPTKRRYLSSFVADRHV